jgi:recombinational DNA repair ATPase RecF
MITALTVQNFRCFRDLKIEPLERVNLIAGRNNAGKTALLEAIYFHVPTYGERLLRENPFRDTQRLSQAKVQLENLFYQKDPQREILIHSRLAPPGSWQVSGKRSRHGDPTRYDYAHLHYQVDDSEYSRLTHDEANDRHETGGPLLPVEAVSSVLTPMTDADHADDGRRYRAFQSTGRAGATEDTH